MENKNYYIDKIRSNDYYFISMIIFSIFATILGLFLWVNMAWNGDLPDNSRYFLSTIAQTQGALGGILISLTLLTVQLASHTYSIKIIDAFLKSKSFWTFFTTYMISIVYSTTMLLIIPRENVFLAPISGYNNYYNILIGIGMFLLISSILSTLYYVYEAFNL